MNPIEPAQTMQVVEISSPGGPEVLQLARRPLPVPGEGEVRIRVAAAGVNRPDVLQRKGAYPPPRGASDIPGLEVSGTIDAVGQGVARWKPGDEVCALVTGGGYSQWCIAPAGQCLPVPAGVGLSDAASLPETYFTVWTNVFQRAALRPGETLLVQGGTSGIGVAAIQLAHALGARVLATAGSAEKCAACQRLGAQRAIDYRNEDFVAVAREQTGGRGVDVILDMVGGEYLQREISACAEDGRIVFINTMGGAKSTINVVEVMVKRLTITGSTLRARPVAVKAGIARELEQRVWPLFEAGSVRPVVHARFPLAEAARAHALMESSTHVGKILLVP
jgi:NADPH2:quinone reductase